MRKITAGLFISLDGVVEAPEKWTRAYASPEIDQEIGSQVAQSDTMLLGRVTYETFAASFAGQKGGIADAMNNMRKVVVSRTLAKAEWQNSVLIRGTDELSKLRQQAGRNIAVNGSPTLLQSLMRDGLLDHLTLMIFPIVLGAGKRLFAGDGNQVQLKLVESKATKTGVLIVRYESALGGHEK